LTIKKILNNEPVDTEDLEWLCSLKDDYHQSYKFLTEHLSCETLSQSCVDYLEHLEQKKNIRREPKKLPIAQILIGGKPEELESLCRSYDCCTPKALEKIVLEDEVLNLETRKLSQCLLELCTPFQMFDDDLIEDAKLFVFNLHGVRRCGER